MSVHVTAKVEEATMNPGDSMTLWLTTGPGMRKRQVEIRVTEAGRFELFTDRDDETSTLQVMTFNRWYPSTEHVPLY